MSVMGIGTHRAKVLAHVLGKSGTGTPHIAVLFENEGGERITWYGYLSDKALERTVASLCVLGWDPAADDGLVSRLHDTDALVGNEAEIVVEHEVYEGKSNAKVKWVNAIGGGLKGVEAGEATALAASLRQKILSAPRPKPNAKPGPAKVPAGAGADVDDDLPF